MCLAVPSKIVEVRGTEATIDVQGARRDVSLLLLPDEVKLGDYVLVHAGFAIQRMDEGAARETLLLIEKMLEEAEGMP